MKNSIVDINEPTEMRQAGLIMPEEELRNSEERFRALFESAPIPIALHGANGRFTETNHAYQQMLGYSNEELLRLGIKGVTYPADIPQGQELFHEMVEGK